MLARFNTTLLLFLSLLFLSLLLAVGQGQTTASHGPIYLAYPPETAVIKAPASFMIGAIPAEKELTCNGEKVRVNQFGFFAHVIRLHYGVNKFVLALDRGYTEELKVRREEPPERICESKLAIRSIEPNQDLGVKPGETVRFLVRATPNSQVVVHLKDRQIKLSNPLINKAASKQSGSIPSRDVAYGEVYDRHVESTADLYRGSYRIDAADRWRSEPIIITLSHSGQSMQCTGGGRISTVPQPLAARTAHSLTIVRLGPGLARTTPLDADIPVQVDGWVGTQSRCQYAFDRHVWIDKADLSMETEKSGLRNPVYAATPQEVARTINVKDCDYGQSVRIPLNQRVPYQIEQRLIPNALTVRLYGVTSDTDWVTMPAETDLSSSSKQACIDHVDWKQPRDDQYEVTVHLSGERQWGYKLYYDETTLCLDVKRPVEPDSAPKKLSGIRICLDPGHGGSESGAIGCSGIREAEINLAISLKLKQVLEAEGASITLTRSAPAENPTLDERVKIATDGGVDFLISIHNNALPDGRDPWKERGSSTYWYHPQAIELAKSLKDSLVQNLGFIDLGARYQNLALARPTAMPAVLVEVGFMINPDEYAKLIDPSFQTKVAEALRDGLLSYLKGKANGR
jgi:N-acetylmuramoyl-L-alanine amidase